MPYNRQIPDAPLPVSMLPRVETFHDDDLVYVVQPQNPVGQRCKSSTIKQLRDRQVMMPKMFITSTAPNFGPWEVDLTGCFPNTSIQLIRPADRGDTTVDMVILKNAPTDVLMTVEISVDYGVLTGSLLVHLESTSNLLGTLRARFYDAGIGVFKNTTKNSWCQLPGTISNEYYDLKVFHKLDVTSFSLKSDGDGFKLIKAADVSGTPPTYTVPSIEFNSAAEAMATPAKFYINTYYQEIKFIFDGVTSDNPTSTFLIDIYLPGCTGVWLIPIDCIATPQNKYIIRYAAVGGSRDPEE